MGNIKSSKSFLGRERVEQAPLRVDNDKLSYVEFTSFPFYEFESNGVVVNGDKSNKATIHFVPGSINIMNVPEKERLLFKINSVKSLLKGLNELIKFIKSNPKTLIGGVYSFEGKTNEFMANFATKRLNIKSKKSFDPAVGESVYHLSFKIKNLIKVFEQIKSKNPKLAKDLELLN